jgi:catechol 2,3-dioxygenase-like lactoylglutathione lyase family enzyme
MLNSASAVLLVPDIAKTMRWYAERLRFTPSPYPETPPYTFCILRHGGVEIMLQQLDGYEKPDLYGRRNGGVWDLYLRVQDVRALSDALAGADDVTVLEPLCPQFYGMTEIVVRDPDGYVIVLAQPS